MCVELNVPRYVYPSDHADKCALDACRARGGELHVMTHPMPPLQRNRWVVRHARRLLACPKETHEVQRSGTWATIRLGRRALGVANVTVIDP